MNQYTFNCRVKIFFWQNKYCKLTFCSVVDIFCGAFFFYKMERKTTFFSISTWKIICIRSLFGTFEVGFCIIKRVQVFIYIINLECLNNSLTFVHFLLVQRKHTLYHFIEVVTTFVSLDYVDNFMIFRLKML